MDTKKDKPKIELILENKKTNQAVIMIPIDIYHGISDLVEENDIDALIALSRAKSPTQELLSLDELNDELGFES